MNYLNFSGSTNKTTVVITVSSHNPDIQGALQDVPNSVFEEYLPLSLATSAPQTQPTAQPVAGLKSVIIFRFPIHSELSLYSYMCYLYTLPGKLLHSISFYFCNILNKVYLNSDNVYDMYVSCF